MHIYKMNITKISVARWIVAFGIMMNSIRLYNYINFHFIFPVLDKIMCPILGSTLRCDSVNSLNKSAFISGLLFLVFDMFTSLNGENYSKIFLKVLPKICSIQLVLHLIAFYYISIWSKEIGSFGHNRLTSYLFQSTVNVFFFAVSWILSILDLNLFISNE